MKPDIPMLGSADHSRGQALLSGLVAGLHNHLQRHPQFARLLRPWLHSIRIIARHTLKRAMLALLRNLPDHWTKDMVFLDPDLHKHGGKRYSQNDEDGIIEYLFSVISPRYRYFVEIGAEPASGQTLGIGGMECNCRLLWERGWSGLFIDGNQYSPEHDVRRERITPMNANEVFRKYGVPHEIDLLSIDIDGQDFWVWSNLSYSPRVVIVEYNPAFGPDESKTIPFDPTYTWDGTRWYGASLRALQRLGESRGYTLVYANGVNAFFVRDELLGNASAFSFERIHGFRGRLEHIQPDPHDRPWVTI